MKTLIVHKNLFEKLLEIQDPNDEASKRGEFIDLRTKNGTPIIWVIGLPIDEVWQIDNIKQIDCKDITPKGIVELL